ncbi:unnamed protein product [Calicophoron daubneyi]|uniref:Uncharacterized protein n=1 Tax=Calicophoron daubneyi TaxID=300641 RepID=A0AAV2T0P2_CALDB
MDERPPRPKLRVNGREMMRIQGVYMYVINRSGKVGAIMGFHPMVIVMYEDCADQEPIKGYLRVDRWMYPLARSFSPVYIWGPDRIIMPEPFSSLTEPIYIVLRIPLATSRYQKDTLWNLLDVNAHLRGTFTNHTPEQIKAMDKHFLLTEITPQDRALLDRSEIGSSPPGTVDLPSLKHHNMEHKLLALDNPGARLSICFATSRGQKAYTPVSNSDKNLSCQGKFSNPFAYTPQKEHHSQLGPTEGDEDHIPWPGGSNRLVLLPPIRGNLMRLYILGPRDLQHIKISTVMEWIPVTQITLSAAQVVFNEQVRLRREKEEYGVPPSFEGRKLRMLRGWGAAESLNLFGVAKPSEAQAKGPYMDLTKIDPAYHEMFQKALRLQDLEAASGVFDYAIDHCRIELLSYSPLMCNIECSSPQPWLGPVIPRDLVMRYRKLLSTFAKLMTISATVESDLVYEKHTNYLERIHEECEHHYPKLRPRNPYLDPKYPYPREPTTYSLDV